MNSRLAAVACLLLLAFAACATPSRVGPPPPTSTEPPVASAGQPQIDPQHPRSRPMIVKQPHARPAENKSSTSDIGPAAYDARWSNYGAYMQRLIETVQIEWDRIMAAGKTYPAKGTYVSVRFRLDKMGRIAEILEVKGTAGSQWEKACASAITSRAPYGEWTAEMISVLGESQEITFTFYYQ